SRMADEHVAQRAVRHGHGSTHPAGGLGSQRSASISALASQPSDVAAMLMWSRTPMFARAGSPRRRWSWRLLGVTVIGPDVILAEEGINISAAIKNAVDDDHRLRDM